MVWDESQEEVQVSNTLAKQFFLERKSVRANNERQFRGNTSLPIPMIFHVRNHMWVFLNATLTLPYSFTDQLRKLWKWLLHS